MSHFAEIDKNGVVKRVIVADQSFIDSGALGDAANWVQTSYNTRAGVHYAHDSNSPDGGTALRKNYAGMGFIYDKTRDAFIAPQPFPSWTLDEKSCTWTPPSPKPNGDYKWDEKSLSWVQI